MNFSRTTIISKSLSALLLCCSLLLTGGLWLNGSTAAYLELLALCGFYVVAADVVLLLWHAFRRHTRLVVIDSVALLAALLPLLLHCLPRFSSMKGDSANLTLVAWNVDNFSLDTRCLEEMAFIAKTQNPDIVCLQERPHNNLMKKERIQAQFPDYPYVAFNDREDEVLNLMVLSKYPIYNVRTRYFSASYNKFLSVDVDVEGRKLRLYNVHLQTTGITDHAGSPLQDILSAVIDNASLRNTQADLLAEDIQGYEGEDIIVCGDFNSSVFSYSCQTVAHGMNDAAWKKPFVLPQSSFLKSAVLPKIDHVFYVGDVECSDYTLTSSSWSDHKMQTAVFRIK